MGPYFKHVEIDNSFQNIQIKMSDQWLSNELNFDIFQP